jgi:glutamine amidotransferase
MCRLLAMTTLEPASIASTVGTEQLRRFRELSSLHDDGWGGAWLDKTGLRWHRSLVRAGDDPDFERIVGGIPTRAGLMHIRWASEGMANSTGNTHPFQGEGLAFAHNGYIGPAAELDPLLPASVVGNLGGTTDSERYFALVQAFRADGLRTADAVQHAVQVLRDRFPEASLNALVISDEELIAVHASERAEPDIEGMLRAGFTHETLPADHLHDYYTLRMRRADGTVSFASSGLDTGGWEPLPAESIAIVDVASGAVSIRPALPYFVG